MAFVTEKELLDDYNNRFNYYRVEFKMIDSFLATGTKASIYEQHVVRKAQKAINKANKLKEKMTKVLENFEGSVISESKELLELQGLVRAYAALIGEVVEIPNDKDSLITLALEVEEKYDELLAKGEIRDATVFIRSAEGLPLISSHMVIGNLKENVRSMMRNKDKSILKAQNSIGGTFASCIHVVEQFMVPDRDIIKDSKGERVLCERPVRFTDKTTFKETTAILSSEQLEEGTKFSCTLRVIKNCPLTEDTLRTLFHMGKQNGFGAHRGSGNHGHYKFKMVKVEPVEYADEEGFI